VGAERIDERNSMHRRLLAMWTLVAFFGFPGSARAAGGDDGPLPARTVAIPMRDGAELAADVLLPAETGQFPTIFVFTPYNRKLLAAAVPAADAVSQLIDRRAYAYVIVDWRGFYGSKPAARANGKGGVNQVGRDGHDVVEWIAGRKWSDGKVGMWGSSALGAAQYRTAVERPPHLTCICPIVIRFGENYVQHYRGGVPKLGRTQARDAAGFTGTAELVHKHPVYDKWWFAVETFTNAGLGRLNVPVLAIGGWYDTETESLIETFARIRSGAGPVAREHSRMLIGPWDHCQAHAGPRRVGELDFAEAAGVSEKEAKLFFDYWLRGKKDNGWADRPVVRYFRMGENRWESAAEWPRTGARSSRWYLGAGGTLTTHAPEGAPASDGFKYDPRDPSPTVGGNNIYVAGAWGGEVTKARSGPIDQRAEVESRGDVLLYISPKLEEDVRLQGSARVRLFVSSDRVDTDVMVRLCDVHPDGRSMLVTDGAHRMRFRGSVEREELMRPGRVHEVTVKLPVTAHTFREGHRIRAVIGSSNYPRFAVNPNSGEHFVTDAGKALLARNRIHRGGDCPSALILPAPAGAAGEPGPAYEKPGPLEVRTLDFPDLVDGKRDRRVPIKVHFPAGQGPFPLVVVSHGGAGNRDANLAQARHLASHGYAVACTEHVRSNTETARRYYARGQSLMGALETLIEDPEALLQRPRDVSFAVDTAERWTADHPQLKGRIDAKRVAVMGHSYGACTTMIVCGARAILDRLRPAVPPGKGLAGDLSDRRVAFGLAMSPQGPGCVFFGPESYRTVNRPLVCLSGTLDAQKGLRGGPSLPATNRLKVFDLLPAGDKHFLWLTGSDHLGFSYNPDARLQFPSRPLGDMQRISRAAMVLFADHYLKKKPEARRPGTSPRRTSSRCAARW
jgi:predicted acyl esterase/predicted dienelactone hydrolase